MKFDIKDCKNPSYTKDGRIDVDLCATNDDGSKETMRFTADQNDCTSHGKEIHKMALAGSFGKIADYVDPPPSPSQPPSRLDKIEAALLAAGIKIP